MSFDLGYGIVVNRGSTLERQWVIVNDPDLPIRISRLRPKTELEDRQWVYKVEYGIEVDEPLSAIEVRFIPFNIWGEKERTLSATEITDFDPGPRNMTGTWRILSENDALEHFAMLAYVSKVKRASGALIHADAESVVEQARQFSKDFTSGDLSEQE